VTLTVGVKKLRRFLKDNKIPKRRAARELLVSLTTVIDWLRGSKTPTVLHREAIQIWTNGEVSLADWVSAKERKAAASVSVVEPFTHATSAHGGE
jgi:hypothetical protein